MNKEVRKLVTSLQRIPDVEVTQGGSGHLLVTKGGEFVVTLSATPSDPRWRENALATLRRAGITPGVRPRKHQAPSKVRQVDVRAELVPIREARQIAEFARFAQQLGEIRGMRTFKTVASAESAIGTLLRDKEKGLAPWGWQLVMAALVEWRRRKPVPEAQLPDMQELPGDVLPRDVVMAQEQTGVKLVIDLNGLTAKLAEFGITLEVR